MNFSNFRRRMSTIFAAGVLAGAVVFGAGQAQAMVYEWDFTNVSFVDNINGEGALEGKFRFDSSAPIANAFTLVDFVLDWTNNAFVDLNFSTSLSALDGAAIGLTGSTAVAFQSRSTNDAYVLIVEYSPSFVATVANFTADNILQVRLNRCALGGCNDLFTYFITGDQYEGSSGIVSAVPVPAALPLFGTGLAIMGFLGWRRKSKAAA